VKFSKSLLFVLMFFMGMSSALSQNISYLCVAENAVGFSFDENTKNWGRANFKTESKYVLSRQSGEKKGWEVITPANKTRNYEINSLYCKHGKNRYQATL
jgi:hypothetical protein